MNKDLIKDISLICEFHPWQQRIVEGFMKPPKTLFTFAYGTANKQPKHKQTLPCLAWGYRFLGVKPFHPCKRRGF